MHHAGNWFTKILCQHAIFIACHSSQVGFHREPMKSRFLYVSLEIFCPSYVVLFAPHPMCRSSYDLTKILYLLEILIAHSRAQLGFHRLPMKSCIHMLHSRICVQLCYFASNCYFFNALQCRHHSEASFMPWSHQDPTSCTHTCHS